MRSADRVDRRPTDANRARIVLAAVAVIAALSLLETILIPVAVVSACIRCGAVPERRSSMEVVLEYCAL